MKGQLISVDVMIGITTVAVITALFTGVFDLGIVGTKNAHAIDSTAQTIGQLIINGKQPASKEYCVSYSNKTSSCAGFSCRGSVSASNRLVNCGGRACRMEVRACL